MAWERKDLDIQTPTFVKELYGALNTLYNDTLVPLVGAKFPPTLGGSLGPVITDIKAIISNLQSIVTDPFASTVGLLAKQMKVILNDLGNSGVEGIIIHPQNVTGNEVKKERLDNPQVLGKNLYTMLDSLQADASSYIDSRTKSFLSEQDFLKINFKTLKPREALNYLKTSLDDVNDPNRPILSKQAFTFGVGFLFTAKTYVDFQALLKVVNNFFTFKDLEQYVQSFDKKISSKLEDAKAWADCIEAYFDQIYKTKQETGESEDKITFKNSVSLDDIHNLYYPTYLKEIKKKEWQTAVKKKETTVALAEFVPSQSFLDWFKARIAKETEGGIDRPIPLIGGTRPDWYGFNVKNTMKPIADLFTLLNVVVDKLNGFAQAGTSSINEAFTILEKRIGQIVSVIASVVNQIKGLITLPKFPGVYTIGFNGVGGNEYIKNEVSKIDLSGVEDNDFTLLIMFAGGSTSDKAFQLLGGIAQTWVDGFDNKSLLDNTSFSPITPDQTTEREKNQKFKGYLPRRVKERLNRQKGKLDSPLVYVSKEIVNNEIYPYLAPYWDQIDGVTEEVSLKKDDGLPRPFAKGTTLEETIDAHNFILKSEASKANDLNSTSIVNFTVDPSIARPLAVYPLNVQDHSTYNTLPFPITWLEEAGVTVTAQLKSTSNLNDFGTVYTEYFKNQPIYQNGSYTLKMKTVSNVNPTLFDEVELQFTININAKNPNPVEIVGVESGKVYATNRTVSWTPENGTNITATLKYNSEDPVPYLTGTPITLEGIYKLEVKTIRSIDPNFYVKKIYNFAIDKQAPAPTKFLYADEIEETTYNAPLQIYWNDVDGATSSGTLQKDSDPEIDIYAGYNITQAGDYLVKVVYSSTVDNKTATTIKNFTII